MDKAGASLNRYIMPPAAADDLFDHIDDLLDFPTDTADFTIPFPPIPTGALDNPPQYLVGDGADSADPPPPNKNNNAAAAAAECYDDGMAGSAKGKRPPAPIADGDGLPPQSHNDMFEDVIDMADLEWLSNFMDDTADSFSLDFPVPPHMELDMDIKFEDNSLFRTPSPVSVLEHSGLVMATGAVAGAGAGAGGGVRSGSSSSASFSSSSSTVSSSGNSFNSDPIPAAFPAKARSKRARPRRFIGPFLAPESPDIDQHVDKKRILEREEAAGVRKCTHCEIQKTPQWRAGPMGPKTLCNACGVRYKSGRLFPEYRPAASPTFVPAIHSNSHKKVVEMRIQTTPNSSSCDLLQYIRRSKEY